MNGIERITRRIAGDAQEAADARLSQARAEADQITARYRAEADAVQKELSERGEKAAAEREERLISMAQMEARKVILAAKQKTVDRAYELALEKLCSLPEARYVEVLAGLLEDASATGTEEVLFSAKDQKTVGQKAVERANGKGRRHLTLSKETADIRGGFILRGRNVEVNCAFETLVRLQKGQGSGDVARLLFPPETEKAAKA